MLIILGSNIISICVYLFHFENPSVILHVYLMKIRFPGHHRSPLLCLQGQMKIHSFRVLLRFRLQGPLQFHRLGLHRCRRPDLHRFHRQDLLSHI